MKAIDNIDLNKFEPADIVAESSERIEKPSLNFWQDAWLRIRKNKGAVFSIFLLAILIIMAFVGPHLSPYAYDKQNISHANLPPKIQGIEKLGIFDGHMKVSGVETDVYKQKNIKEYYWFGTDSLGRDIFSRAWKGTQVSLYIAFLAALIDMVIGVVYGLVSGYYGGNVDNVMQRILEVISGLPQLVIVILMILVLNPGIISITVALTITGWTGMARVVRGQVLKLKSQEYILASRTLGESNGKIMFKHLIPNLSSVIIINTMFTIPNAIFFEAFLSFIGLGLQPPKASLGTLIEDGFTTMQFLPFQLLIPAIIISLLMITFNLIADGLRDAFDPKSRD
ncbi:ABC transporter permease [Bacillus ginsengihumi]|uniref:ABC transporter permease n=2 Tax=Heyndrickxia ginsengihumi TaxID=363870 RepID=A0A0A6VG36_9BACI|nr:oligopeptide ABC transporter permease [Heyndrickxia ginsengihumi]KHD85589.1 peptide ABC transporter permease [Heyndrickxia ginsengihumi]MBE6184021.1 ABC transporter permease [Bacillus sp. (in: firmicutes)]MCM3023564.1 ABC transporter permease [Heyndrickxia ginsengihumi]NEY18829.1 ABC transporter permease [Heyndrickxia ginsengihumi]